MPWAESLTAMRAFLQNLCRRWAEWRERLWIMSGTRYFDVVERKKALYAAHIKEIDKARERRLRIVARQGSQPRDPRRI